ncbi:MAG: DNA repair protein RecO [Candidatus Kerfeldbacteria bacterium RIFCSPHIGHO2_02_FULL_42_14]|uniref:DNA repair protein RecO n=1 Tax=Candidatus Kerfeldbacteria bacterium RIFCSPHIGHO2_02_FULL_42_14 TaxID=1798540 RepID=A0A1G2ANV8_9BACT|nr:MAG: DNA repair protein RecO [Candidatus Kerfeldbacteria bacterium RIFCSPHIGHO2_02_FULL_42_14]OGY80813.1 MAG: DNA repair protein RecO [Candidatus Kerfeldbacteria bacterium RIFCSPHIGHO2_12_FULL_42_13]OGY84985.1 MAG: DNA repair protein RecO [Candidatus Kerfeldbacteria bacterium RIFCSPLOWO2_02_FULL_42_19]OGY86152.1 MAG: DNA repair protein RecO [Candidatus Kerfeldbacteria bacterium RIFCSPLOWO2_12_FULL_43_9]
MATWKTEGFVLKRVPWKEYDGLYTLYTRENGKIIVRAQGIRKITSKLAGHCEPFMKSNFLLAQGKYWDQLAGSQIREAYPTLRTILSHLRTAQSLTHSLDTLTQEAQSDVRIYELLGDAFNFLNTIEKAAGTIWCFAYTWRWKLIAYLGYAPALDQCVAHKHIFRGQHFFDIQHGGIVCQKHINVSHSIAITKTTLMLLEKALQYPFQAMQKEKATQQEWELFGRIIDRFTGYHVPGHRKNRSTYQQLHKHQLYV